MSKLSVNYLLQLWLNIVKYWLAIEGLRTLKYFFKKRLQFLLIYCYSSKKKDLFIFLNLKSKTEENKQHETNQYFRVTPLEKHSFLSYETNCRPFKRLASFSQKWCSLLYLYTNIHAVASICSCSTFISLLYMCVCVRVVSRAEMQFVVFSRLNRYSHENFFVFCFLTVCIDKFVCFRLKEIVELL